MSNLLCPQNSNKSLLPQLHFHFLSLQKFDVFLYLTNEQTSFQNLSELIMRRQLHVLTGDLVVTPLAPTPETNKHNNHPITEGT